jgi:hypothetical protein
MSIESYEEDESIRWSRGFRLPVKRERNMPMKLTIRMIVIIIQNLSLPPTVSVSKRSWPSSDAATHLNPRAIISFSYTPRYVST